MEEDDPSSSCSSSVEEDSTDRGDCPPPKKIITPLAYPTFQHYPYCMANPSTPVVVTTVNVHWQIRYTAIDLTNLWPTIQQASEEGYRFVSMDYVAGPVYDAAPQGGDPHWCECGPCNISRHH